VNVAELMEKPSRAAALVGAIGRALPPPEGKV